MDTGIEGVGIGNSGVRLGETFNREDGEQEKSAGKSRHPEMLENGTQTN